MNRLPDRAWRLVTIGIVLVASALYLGGTARCGAMGFPLDDGWIHQTYARNLAQYGEFSFVPGQASAGSTSPLWTLLLAIGYGLRLPPMLWTNMLGAAGWLSIGWTGAALTRRLFPRHRALAVWVGLACLLEWHLAWAAFSGMETTLFSFLALLLVDRYARGVHPFVLGVIGGLLFLARPEGMLLTVLLGVVVLAEWWGRPAHRRLTGKSGILSTLADMGAGLAVLVVPYVVFNQVVSGQMMPNTFYAKQAEYRELLSNPLWVRLWTVVRRPLIGAQVLLVPGFVGQAVGTIRGLAQRTSWRGNETTEGDAPSALLVLLPLAWWTCSFAVYALRMPVDYQYGRYLMPTIPVFLIYGIVGTARWLRPRSPWLVVRVLSKAAPLALGCLFVLFLLRGSSAYVEDVCMINCEMVAVAQWLDTHVGPDALVAAHDIGAIGYFSQRPLVDLAGLITPKVVPFIRDESRLLAFVIDQGADYVVAFPSWYPNMVAREELQQVYQTDCQATREKGADNLTVYLVRP